LRGSRGNVYTWLNRKVENLVNRLNVLVGGRMQHDDDSPDQAEGASQLSERAEFLAEEIRPENSSYQDGESTQRGDQNGGRKRIGGKVANLSRNHYFCPKSAGDP